MKSTYLAVLAYGKRMTVVASGNAVQATLAGNKFAAHAIYNWTQRKKASCRPGIKPRVFIARITQTIG